MARGVVVVYFSWFGKPLQWHHKVVLDLNAKAIARIKGYKFGGLYDPEHNYSSPLFFVPDDTLLLDEAACLGIRSPNDLYGGVVPHLFAKTKAITHGLVGPDAERPPGWSTAFAERVREIEEERAGIVMFRIVAPLKLTTLDACDSVGVQVEHDFVMRLQRLAEPRDVEHDGAICHGNRPPSGCPIRNGR